MKTYLMKDSVKGKHSSPSVMASISNQTISSFQCPITFDFDPTNITHLPASVVPTWIFFVAINTATSTLTVLINLLVIWTVLANKQLRSDRYYLLVAILLLSDILVGIVVQPLLIALGVCIIDQCTYLCELTIAYTVSASLCYGWTAVTMAIVSLERYLYIEHPMYYQTSVTSKKLVIASAASWVLVGIPKPFTRLLMNDSFWNRQLIGILTFGPCFVIILFCVTKINLTARRQIRVIVAQQQTVAEQSKIKEYKRTFTLGLIVLASVACMCPIIILKIVKAVKGNFDDDIKYISHGIYFTFLNFQSIINPIIYSLRLSPIRSGVTKRLCYDRQ